MPSFRILLVTIAAAVLVLHCGNPRVSAQEPLPRVGVLRVENRTGNRTYDTLADTIRTTVSLSLLLMGDYDVIDRNASVGANPVETADAIPVDTLVWGSVTEEADDTLTVSLTVFDRATARVVTSDTERSPTLLGVFDASDRLVRRVIGSFSGRRVGFGSVRLNVAGAGSYRVMLDGTSMGTDLTSLDRVLAGRYRLVVEQRLPAGYRRIVSEQVEITDGDRLVVNVRLLDAGAVASAERERIRDALDAVLAGDPGPEFRAAPVEALLADYARSTPDGDGLSWYRDRLDLQLEYRRILDHRYRVNGTLAIPDSLADGFLAASYRVVHDRDMRVSDPNTPVDGELAENRFRRLELEQLVRRNIGAVVGIMVLASDYAAVTGDLSGMERPHRLVHQLTRDGLWPRDAVPAVERRAALAAVTAHDRAVERQRPGWQLLAIGAGVAGVATSGYLFGSGVVADSLNDADTAYAAYQTSTDSAEIADLRNEVEQGYNTANMLSAVGIGSGVVGAGGIAAGIIARIRSVRRPDRIRATYLETIGDARTAAAIAFFSGDGDRLILVSRSRDDGRETRRTLTIGVQHPQPVNGPTVYPDVAPGEEIVWTGLNWPNGEVMVRHAMHGGRNVVYLP